MCKLGGFFPNPNEDKTEDDLGLLDPNALEDDEWEAIVKAKSILDAKADEAEAADKEANG
jgi:hypothetical protein